MRFYCYWNVWLQISPNVLDRQTGRSLQDFLWLDVMRACLVMMSVLSSLCSNMMIQVQHLQPVFSLSLGCTSSSVSPSLCTCRYPRPHSCVMPVAVSGPINLLSVLSALVKKPLPWPVTRMSLRKTGHPFITQWLFCCCLLFSIVCIGACEMKTMLSAFGAALSAVSPSLRAVQDK